MIEAIAATLVLAAGTFLYGGFVLVFGNVWEDDSE